MEKTERVCDQCIFDEKLWKALPDARKNTTCDRCKRRHCVTKVTVASRERDIRPPRPAKSIDWPALKQEYFEQIQHVSLAAFLRSKGWSDTQINNGNTKENTGGWGTERELFRNAALEAAREASKRAIVDMIPDIYAAKKKIIEHLIRQATTQDKVRDTIDILEALKTELGEPTRVSKSQIALDDSIDEALKELRSVVSTGRKGENDGGGATVPATTATTPDPS